jgi:hypothetical protein
MVSSAGTVWRDGKLKHLPVVPDLLLALRSSSSSTTVA